MDDAQRNPLLLPEQRGSLPGCVALRLLLGFYGFLGGVYLLMPVVMEVDWQLRRQGYPQLHLTRPAGGIQITILVILAIIGLLHLLLALGIWKGWPLVRYVLLGISIYCVVAAVPGFVLTVMALLNVGNTRRLAGEPLASLLIVLGVTVFAVWQWRAFMSPEAKARFRVRKRGQTLTDGECGAHPATSMRDAQPDQTLMMFFRSAT